MQLLEKALGSQHISETPCCYSVCSESTHYQVDFHGKKHHRVCPLANRYLDPFRVGFLAGHG